MSNNGKFLTEILPSQNVSEVKWRGNTIKVTARVVQQFESMKLKFLNNLLLNLEKRFPTDSTNVINAFGILSLRNVRFQNENLSTYRNEELVTLLSRYGSAKKMQGSTDVPAVVDAKKCRIEWNFVKELVVREHYTVGHIAKLWKMLATHHSEENGYN